MFFKIKRKNAYAGDEDVKIYADDNNNDNEDL